MTTFANTSAPASATGLLHNRWFQLLIGLICMMAISSPQYVWTLFTKPLSTKLGVPLSQLQITFSMLIVLQTFFAPFQGRLIERFGARRLISIGTLLSGLSWMLASQASSIGMLYLTVWSAASAPASSTSAWSARWCAGFRTAAASRLAWWLRATVWARS